MTVHVGDCRDVLAVAFDDDTFDAVVTDPPYGLSREPDAAEVLRHWLAGDDYAHGAAGFMGKTWDSFVPGPATWREVYRVLKPGGHALVFAGTRTVDLMGVALRLAGFEIRDAVAWVYGTGFPKSIDVGAHIDKLDAAAERRARNLTFTAWMRSQGLTAAELDQITSTNMGGHYLTDASQPAVPTAELFDLIRPWVGDVPDEIEALVAERTVESANHAARRVVGIREGAASGWDTDGGTEYKDRPVTVAHTAEARQWQGWGSALKPAFEPVIVARKPLAGTIAANVLRFGTGALNIDGCRVPLAGDADAEAFATNHAVTERLPADRAGAALGLHDGGWKQRVGPAEVPPGRFPANLIHDGSPEVLGAFPEAPGAQSAVKGTEPGANGFTGAVGLGGGFAGRKAETVPRGDRGSAARFFYCAKATKADRGPGNVHPTVKPVDLMRYLCRLVTRPGGLILDPFAGSGSTGKAAALEGFEFVGIEQSAEYAEIARSRIAAAKAA